MYTRDIFTRPVVTVGPETPLPQAVLLLTEHGFAALPVVDDADHVIGILSESDALSASDNRPTATVQSVMTIPAEVVEPGTDIATVAARMLTRRLRSMPVVEAGILVGIVARRDLLHALVRDNAAVEAKVRALLDNYAGSRRQWTIQVDDGRAVIRGMFADAAEQHTVSALALTVDEVTHAETVTGPTPSAETTTPPLAEWLHRKADETIS
ncbi:CBS domain-containing protein [Nocardia australiensis]|uniref:CBS domain-containing protein n=1 Tax=Nocardia australiensis TaxID=2887191 RepID=UPI001D13DCA4|nr:CBS domain-containing protein [Nocardia australiensis]